MLRPLQTVVAVLLALPASAQQSIGQLQAEVTARGVDAVNARLEQSWERESVALFRSVAACGERAIALAATLHRSSNATMNQAHGESLRAAMARCPSTVLKHLGQHEVGAVCWVGESAADQDYEQETKRRIAKLLSAKAQAVTPKIQACVASFQDDLRRVKLGPWQSNQDSYRQRR